MAMTNDDIGVESVIYSLNSGIPAEFRFTYHMSCDYSRGSNRFVWGMFVLLQSCRFVALLMLPFTNL